jgi:hypothetical protein
MSLKPVQPSNAVSSHLADDRRLEKRVHIAVAVKVFSDATATDSQTCCTYEISTFGARLVAPNVVREVGQIIALQRQNRRAPYKVIWIGKPGTSLEGQVGVEALDRNSFIWEHEIKARLKQAE